MKGRNIHIGRLEASVMAMDGNQPGITLARSRNTAASAVATTF